MTAPTAPARAAAGPVIPSIEAPAGGPRSEVEGRADFSQLRYAQCWEDADVLVAGLAVRPGDTVLSVASAGDNTLALLVERGSLLSHSAIVARELGLPAVVAIDGLTSWLETGDEVEMDGRTGEVRRLARAGGA